MDIELAQALEEIESLKKENAELKGSDKPEDILKELRFYYTKAILEKIKRLETDNSVLQDLVESNKRFYKGIFVCVQTQRNLLKNLCVQEKKKCLCKGVRKVKDEIKKKFEEWIKENGGTDGVLFQTFSDDELEHIFMSAYEKNKR